MIGGQFRTVSGRLRGHVAMVTGAGSIDGVGVGAAAAVLFARAGARVVLVDRDLAAAERTAELVGGPDDRVHAVQADVSVESAVIEAVDSCIDRFGKIDVLQNTVGVARLGGLAETSMQDLISLYAINVGGAFLTSRHVLPHMASRGGGSIVNVSSVASSRTSGSPAVAYGVSKAALEQLTRIVAREGAPGNVRCNAVVAGSLDTPAARRGVDDEDYQSSSRVRAGAVPLARLGDPWDVASACLFLACKESAYVTGAMLPVDGGLSLL